MLNQLLNAIKSFSLCGLWGWAGGRNFLLAVWFSITAFWLAKHGILTSEYSAVIVAIHGLSTWRSIHDDKKEVALAGMNDDDPANTPSSS